MLADLAHSITTGLDKYTPAQKAPNLPRYFVTNIHAQTAINALDVRSQMLLIRVREQLILVPCVLYLASGDPRAPTTRSGPMAAPAGAA